MERTRRAAPRCVIRIPLYIIGTILRLRLCSTGKHQLEVFSYAQKPTPDPQDHHLRRNDGTCHSSLPRARIPTDRSLSHRNQLSSDCRDCDAVRSRLERDLLCRRGSDRRSDSDRNQSLYYTLQTLIRCFDGACVLQKAKRPARHHSFLSPRRSPC